MKKVGKYLIVCLTLVSLFLLIGFQHVSAGLENDTYTLADGTRFKMDQLVVENQLDEGVLHNKYTAYASSPLDGFSAAGSDSSGGTNIPNQLYPQSVNTITVPVTTEAKIVNWTFTSKSSWSLTTVRQMAADFEAKNPGWSVAAAVNGDFFDINALAAFPYMTSGAIVANGEVLKPVSSGANTIGITNDGTVNSLFSGSFTTGDYELAIYNELDEIVYRFDVKKINELPAADEVSVYYSYPVFVDSARVQQNQTAPANSYVAENATRILGQTATSVYAMGSVEKMTTETIININKFAVYTTNAVINDALEGSAKVRVQRKVTGDFADCETVLGCGVSLVENGTEVVRNNKERHPRTVIGRKADGTIMFITVDGRQANNDMYGMTYDELSATLLYFGCVEGYNLDGGGSTTIIVKENNKFVTYNSPSDGNERKDSNALLVVVPKLIAAISKVTGDSVTVTVPEVAAFSNVKANVNNTSVPLVGGTAVVTGLTAHTDYTLYISYDWTNEGKTVSRNGDNIAFRTGKQPVNITNLLVYENEDYYELVFDLHDPDSAVASITVLYNRTADSVAFAEGTVTKRFDISSMENVRLSVSINYESTPNETIILELNAPIVVVDIPEKGCFKGGTVYLLSFTVLTSLLGVVILRKHN